MAHSQTIHRIIRALRSAIDEHGLPNGFSPGELEDHGGPSAPTIGRLLRVQVFADVVGDELGVRLRYDRAARRVQVDELGS